MSGWPAGLLEAVGEGYRAAGAEGGDESNRLAGAVVAYLTAGGEPGAAAVVVPEMIRHLGRTRQDWLLETAPKWVESGRSFMRRER